VIIPDGDKWHNYRGGIGREHWRKGTFDEVVRKHVSEEMTSEEQFKWEDAAKHPKMGVGVGAEGTAKAKA
jgi:hypothetical protein